MKPSTHQGKSYKSIIGKRELMCNKCGFVTFSLHLLYSHKYKCKGKLLGKPVFCSYCKRKFSFITLYKKHKVTCVRKAVRKRFLKDKLAKKHLIQENKSEQVSSYKFSLSCPICHASFKSKLNFVDHLKQQSCNIQQTKTKKSFSARKSLNSHKNSKVSNIYDKNVSSHVIQQDNFIDSKNRELHRCLWCKSEYPSEQLLFMHFKMNEQCAIAYYKKHCPDVNKKISVKARKTISVKARKSFPQKKYGEKQISYKVSSYNSGTARKSLASSTKKKESNKYHRSSVSNKLNQCPVCHEDFPDTFTFYQHQKMRNHWGKATKTLIVNCKCPFCDKEFMHIKSRNAHVYNHTDRSEKEIKAFLKSCTCNVCLQTFVSETAKFQHMKIEHPNDMKYLTSGSNTVSENEYDDKHKMSSVPSSVKKKLRQEPNSCPVCSKTFSHTVLRNKHFNEVHLKIFECQFCNTKFKSTSSLTTHIQLAHGKNLDCKGCTASFSNELELLQHILKYHPNEDPRLLLPSKSIKNTSPNENNQNIVENITVRHSVETNSNSISSRKNIEYYCDVCDIGYQKLCGLQKHRQSRFHKETLEKSLDAFQKTLSNLPSSSSPTIPRIVKQPEIITCSECSDEFTNIKDFVPHRLSHFSVQSKYLRINELNPYMCEICSDVLDSHSKVQLHLFWHLQVESTSNKNNNIGNSKNDTIVPDRLSGQHVAKKSFSKPKEEYTQEVVIGGVSKPLFTCEACNIGFTTKIHYNIHVRKLCKKLKFVKHASNSEIDVNNESLDNAETEIVHCRNCNFLFISETIFGQHKQFCIKCHFDSDSEEISNNLEAIKSALSQQSIVAGCVTCAALFDNVVNIETHIIAHQTDENAISDEIADLLHCALCNSLFTLSAFNEHKNFCKIPVNISRKITKSKHVDVLKSALELKCAVAACISCGLPFDDLESFSEHLILHQTNQIQNDAVDKRSTYEQTSNNETKQNAVNFGSETSLVDNATDFLTADLMSNIESDDEGSKISNKYFDNNEDSFVSLTVGESKKSPPEQINTTSNSLKELRENFSHLLSLLISDSELMQKLGFGKLDVDDVLINVLKQMGQKPHTDNGPKIDLFRKNIKMLLGLCLKEQFLQTIGKDKLADEMVVEALNIFTSEEMDYDSD